jgi:transposase
MLKGGTFRPHAKMFECHEHTVRATIKRWPSSGLSGLWEADGRGAKRRWSDEDMEYIETCLKDRTPTYNSLQLSRKLTQARAVNLSSDRLREILKKKTTDGNVPVTVIAKSKTGSKGRPYRLTSICWNWRRRSVRLS